MSFVYCFSQLQISDAWFDNLLAICGFPNFSQYTSSDIHSLEYYVCIAHIKADLLSALFMFELPLLVIFSSFAPMMWWRTLKN